METVVGFVENEGKIVESEVEQDGSTLSPNQIADPVVYKLVRVSSFHLICLNFDVFIPS